MSVSVCVRVDACVCETERESFQSFIVSLLSYIGPESAKLVFFVLFGSLTKKYTIIVTVVSNSPSITNWGCLLYNTVVNRGQKYADNFCLHKFVQYNQQCSCAYMRSAVTKQI